MLPTTLPRRYPALSSFALEYNNPQFVGDQVFPIVESETKDVRYGILDKLNMFQNVPDELAKDGEANEVGFGAATDIKMMKNYALKTTISREDTADAESFVNVAMDQVTILRAALALRREVRQANLLYTKLDGAGRSATSAVLWSDKTGSAPDIVAQVRDLRNLALYPYTKAVCPKQVFIQLERAPSLVSQWFTGNTGMKVLTQAQIEETLGVSLLIPDGRVSAQRRPGPIVGSMDAIGRIWGNHFFLLRVTDTIPNRMEPGCGYQFRRRWTKGTVGDNMQVRAWYEPRLGIGGSDVVQQEYQALDLVLSTDMGYVLKNVV